MLMLTHVYLDRELLSVASEVGLANMSTTPWPLATHPVAILTFLVCHCAVMVGFTFPDSLLRPALLPLQPLVASLLFKTEAMGDWGTATRTLISSVIIFMPLQYLDLVLLSGWSFAAQGPTTLWNGDRMGTTAAHGASTNGHRAGPKHPAPSHSSVWSRFRFGLVTTLSFRHLDTPYEARNSPHFSAKDESYVPSRSAYLLRTFVIFLASALLVDFSFAVHGIEGAAIPISMAQVPLFSRLREVTAQEAIERAVIVALAWLNCYCLVQACYSFLGVVLVGLGIYDVKDFRPAMGDVCRGYTIRKFWG